jgi:uncharacterized membrane protein YbhN (UPF0104 family)
MRAEDVSAATGSFGGGRWKPALKRVFIGALFLTVLLLLARYARSVDWPAVATAVRGYAASSLLLAGVLALASHALYSIYDLIGRWQTKHPLRAARVLATAFVSYAFNLNLGALVGGVALRYRLYSRQGLTPDTITQVLALSVITNWLGYLLLAGVALLLYPLAPPPDWGLDAVRLHLLGLLLLAFAGAYLLLCAAGGRRVWRLRKLQLRWPSWRVALLQFGVSSLNWMLIAGVVAVLLKAQVAYPTVLCTLLIAAVAGALTHVPAGLGVLEAVFITLLSHRVPLPELLAALLVYRAIYYLAPLGVALGVYLYLETQAKNAAMATQAAPARCSAHGA